MKIDKFNGAVVFDMSYQTPRRRARHTAMLAELGTDTDEPKDIMIWNASFFLCLTDDIKVKGKGEMLAQLKAFWEKANDGTPIAEVIDFYLDNVPYKIHVAWVEAWKQTDQPVIPVPLEQKSPELLTEAERADPN